MIMASWGSPAFLKAFPLQVVRPWYLEEGKKGMSFPKKFTWTLLLTWISWGEGGFAWIYTSKTGDI